MLKQTKKSNPATSFKHACFCLQTDTEGTILSASPEFLTFTGRTQKELIVLSLKNIVSTAQAKKIAPLLRKAAAKSGIIILLTVKGKMGICKVHFTIEHITEKVRGNNTIRLAWNAPPPGTMKVVGKDQLPEREKWFERYFRNSNDLLCIVDRDGYIRDVKDRKSVV